MNIPNILTILRLLVLPIFGYFLFKEEYTVSVIIFIAAGLTDILDGYIARKYNMVTAWGKLADPMADKLMQITALIILTYHKNIDYRILLIIITKELLMITGSIILYKKLKYIAKANWYGKVATVMFYFAIIMIIFGIPYSEVALIISVIATLFALAMYTLTYFKIKSENS